MSPLPHFDSSHQILNSSISSHLHSPFLLIQIRINKNKNKNKQNVSCLSDFLLPFLLAFFFSLVQIKTMIILQRGGNTPNHIPSQIPYSCCGKSGRLVFPWIQFLVESLTVFAQLRILGKQTKLQSSFWTPLKQKFFKHSLVALAFTYHK